MAIQLAIVLSLFSLAACSAPSASAQWRKLVRREAKHGILGPHSLMDMTSQTGTDKAKSPVPPQNWKHPDALPVSSFKDLFLRKEITAHSTIADERLTFSARQTENIFRELLHRNRDVALKAATDMDNPWEGAMECLQAHENECTCGNWARWANVGGFTPAPCMQNTIASVYALSKFVHGLGYTAYLNGGTLIGAMRCGAFVPWDYDADVNINTPNAEEAGVLAAKVKDWAGGAQKPSSVFVTISGDNEWHADNPKATKNGNVHLDIGYDHQEVPLIPCVLNDVVVHCPADYNERLIKKYGGDWKTTPKRWKKWLEKLAAAVKEDEAKLQTCESRMESLETALAKFK